MEYSCAKRIAKFLQVSILYILLQTQSYSQNDMVIDSQQSSKL
jgi:hypothetical protein